MKSKKEIRRACLKLLKETPQAERLAEQHEIEAQVVSFLKDEIKLVSIYVSQVWEVGTHHLIKLCLERKIKVCCPKVMGPGKMEHFLIDSFDDLHLSKMNILEPEVIENKQVKPDELDLILVPGVAFTENGQRLGYGGGFYDCFLKEVKGYKIGLSFKNQLFFELPTENHDVQLDCILSSKL